MAYGASTGTRFDLGPPGAPAGDTVGGDCEVRHPATGRLVGCVLFAGILQAFAVGLVLHRLHDDPNEAHEAVFVSPLVHWLRDSALAAPGGILLLLTATLLARRIVARHPGARDGVRAHLLWAALGAVAYAVASVPAAMLHAQLFSAHHEGTGFLLHSAREAVLTLRYSFAILAGVALAGGLPWNPGTTSAEDR